jgi:hypothetical protein
LSNNHHCCAERHLAGAGVETDMRATVSMVAMVSLPSAVYGMHLTEFFFKPGGMPQP